MAENPELRARERGPGAALAAARTAQNLTVADVARQLKLSVSQVAALEAGEYERLPGPVFVRGFVRNYARLLKMDPDRVLGMVSDAPAPAVPDQMPTSRGVPFSTRTVRRWPRMALLVVLLAVVALGAYEFYWRDAAIFGPVPSERIIAPVAVPPAKPEPASVLAPAPAVETAAPPVAAPEAVAAAPSEGSAERPAAAPQGEQSELRFVFGRDSWVQVRDGSGEMIMTRLNAAGTEQRVAGKPPFALVIGNARGVQLFHNDRPVDLKPHIVRDDVARFRLE